MQQARILIWKYTETGEKPVPDALLTTRPGGYGSNRKSGWRYIPLSSPRRQALCGQFALVSATPVSNLIHNPNEDK